MKTIIIVAAAAFLSACSARPFEQTSTIYDSKYLLENPILTQVRVHRVKQLSGSALGEDCPLVVKVDNEEIAGLQQNQYIDLYLPSGKHTISIRFKCALTAWRRSVELNADGNYQEYSAESGSVGQYSMQRIK